MANVLQGVRDAYTELKDNVTWPTLPQLSQTAVLVLVASLIIALVVFGMDKLVTTLLEILVYNN
ncbi:MAG: preprotein translocase subunit SecE [Paludibacteraceae bacterium]|nr:preprotein translocase subunit SecE [Candidatus Physcocola equi]MCQ2234576.1 preprotein translocase subunit SecE [Paludibacteraceae bacterium]